MTFVFAISRRSYTVEVPLARFLHLLDSESHVTDCAAYKPGKKTLCEKLTLLPGVHDVDYNGHTGACIHLSIYDDKDNVDLKVLIADTIDQHLTWCEKIKKDSRFAHDSAAQLETA